MYKENEKKILVCDFGASLNYTHHLQYIRSHVMFLKRNYTNMVVEVILPMASEIDPSEFAPANFTRKLLLPVFHFPHTRVSLISTWFTFFWKKFGKLICKFDHRLYVSLSVFIVTPFFIFSKANLIVFPTVCAQSLKLIEVLEFFHVKKSIHIHFSNSAEIRKPYGSFQNCENFVEKSNKFKFVNIVFSFETQTLFDFYSRLNIKQNYYLARQPSTNNLNPLFFLKSPSLSEINIIKVLIMGRPAVPGRDSIIANSLIEFKNKTQYMNQFINKNFEFGVTLEDSSIIEAINHSSENYFTIKKLPNAMGYPNLVNLLNTATVLVLPYEIECYRLNHSGMLFLSSDLHLPIVTCEGACFSDEVIEFKLGNLFNNKDSFANALIQTLINLNTFNFEEYFKVREWENQKVYEHLNFK